MIKRLPHKLAKGFAASLGIASCALWWAGHTLSAPRNHPVGSPPPELAAKAVQFGSVHGWFTPAEKAQSCKKVAAVGKSMGGAASLLGPAPLAANALVLEAVYPTIEEAAANRLAMRFGKFGTALAPLIYAQIPLRLNAPLDALRPIDAIRKVHCPVLVIGGGNDRHTTAAETQRLFAQAPGEKELWLIEGAAHQDFYRFAGQAYEKKLAAFLGKHLA